MMQQEVGHVQPVSQIRKMRYRLGLDLGTTSIGWAMLRLDEENKPCAIIKAGVRIFSDGRNPKDGASLAVARREARAMRRRRDRLLRRKARMMRLLITFGFFPSDIDARKTLERLDPYLLRAKGLDEPLRPEEFARALFHINQRRGFKSNRKTDKAESDGSALKGAIKRLHDVIHPDGLDGRARTVGEWLHRRELVGQTVRARYREQRVQREDGKSRIEKSYDLYVDRAMVEAEFDQLWNRQNSFNPSLFNAEARDALKDCLLYQRKLRPVKPGRCTLMPHLTRAPLALPSQQRFRLYQEVNNLRIVGANGSETTLSLASRDAIIAEMEGSSRKTFASLRKLIGASSGSQFNLEDLKRTELKGNQTSSVLRKADHFGPDWDGFPHAKQDEIVERLITEESEAELVAWLVAETGITESVAERIANVSLPEGYGSLSAAALAKILPELQKDVVTYDKAVLAAGFDHHSNISHASTGEVLPLLPYYGEYLTRHVGFGTGDPADSPEKRFGKIANPTVHIGLNQIRKVVNELIGRYGHPSEVIVEVARDLKQNREQKADQQRQQAENQKRNERIRAELSGLLHVAEYAVKTADIQKFILWEELAADPLERRCPYSGVQISKAMLMSDEVEIEHILPFSKTLDDSLNNKTVAARRANRIKGNRTPAEAATDFAREGWQMEDMLARAALMPKNKRYRFATDGYERWSKDQGFLARALNDTRYLSRIAKEYLNLVCPNTRVIPGQMTALLRGKFGLNDILGRSGEKNRDDHRHHAVDACVIAVTDQGLLQRFAQASASTREQQLSRLVERMPEPWPGYRDHVERAVKAIYVSFKPDHSHEGAMHNATAYGLLGEGQVVTTKVVDGIRRRDPESLRVIEIAAPEQAGRHGTHADGSPRPYKGYKGDSNYCIEIVLNEKGKWIGEVISTFDAYQIVRHGGVDRLRGPVSVSGKPLVMRLMVHDCLRLSVDGKATVVRIAKIKGSGEIFMAEHFEANVDKRDRDPGSGWKYLNKSAGALQKSAARLLTTTPAGQLSRA